MRTVEKTTLLRVAHLEDNSLDAQLILYELENAGIDCAVTQVCSRLEFEAMLEKGEIDLILSDSQIPGYDTLKALTRTREMRPEVPFVFVSGSTSPAAKTNAFFRGATGFVSKNELPKLVSLVKRIIAAKKGKPVNAPLPEIGVPVMVRCPEFSCLGYLDKKGIWRDFKGSEELRNVIDWAEL